MFTYEDSILILEQLEKKEPAHDHAFLRSVLEKMVQEKNLQIETIQELSDFMYSFPEEKDINLLSRYFMYQKRIRDQFSSIDVFIAFCRPDPERLSKVNFLFLNKLLYVKTKELIHNQKDVRKYVSLLSTTMDRKGIFTFFNKLQTDLIHHLFEPFHLSSTHARIEDDEEEIIVRNYDMIRAKVRYVFELNLDPLTELIKDLFYEWAQQDPHNKALNKKIRECLHHLARYLRYQEQTTQQYNQFSDYSFPPLNQSDQALLVDVDGTMIAISEESNRSFKPLVFNNALIKTLKNKGLPVFLFTDVPCTFVVVWQRLKIIEYLKQQGVAVIGVLTPGDLIADIPIRDIEPIDLTQDDHLLANNFLIQALLARLANNQLPPTLGKAFKDATVFFERAKEEYCAQYGPLSPDAKTEWEQIITIVYKHNVVKNQDKYYAKIWKTIRRVDELDQQMTEREYTHIKWQMLRQVMTYYPHLTRIEMYDDQGPLLNYVTELAEEDAPGVVTTFKICFQPRPESPPTPKKASTSPRPKTAMFPPVANKRGVLEIGEESATLIPTSTGSGKGTGKDKSVSIFSPENTTSSTTTDGKASCCCFPLITR